MSSLENTFLITPLSKSELMEWVSYLGRVHIRQKTEQGHLGPFTLEDLAYLLIIWTDHFLIEKCVMPYLPRRGTAGKLNNCCWFSR